MPDDLKSEKEITPEERIIELNEEFAKEMAEWEKMDVDPNVVINFNPFRVDSWVQALTLFLVEKGVIESENEFIIFLKEKQIEKLAEIRLQVEAAMRETRLKGMGVDLPNMAVPKGRVRRFND